MIVRRMLPYVLAALLGVGAALLAACAGGTTRGIPAGSAGVLKEDVKDVLQAVEGNRCKDVPGQLRQVDDRLDALPPSTDDQLARSLRDGVQQLREVAIEECNAEPTTTSEKTETTPAETTPAETTTETTTTQTTPPVTTPAPETTPAPPPPTTTTPAPPPPPPGTPGGGTPPEVP